MARSKVSKLLNRGQQGLTLVEILIVLAVMAIMAGVVIPNVTGYVSRGKERAYEADQRSLQAAVNSWRTNVGARTGNPFPVLDNTGCVGTPTTLGGSCNSFVNMAALSDENYLPGTASVKSADPNKNTTATNTPGGSYGWYIDSTGLIRSDPPFVAGRYP